MSGRSQILISRAAVSGVLLILLGAWGALIPFVGPYFHFAYTPDTSWHFTLARLWLEILPGVTASLGGVLIITSSRRLPSAGGMVAAALAGGWFALGNVVNQLWPHLGTPGVPAGSARQVALEGIGFFTGLGIVIVFVAALALGRLSASAADAGPVPATAAADYILPVEE